MVAVPIRESLDHRERAYTGYLARRRHLEAVVAALDISVCQLSNLDNPVAARGWIARACRAAELSGDDQLDGWLWLMEGYTCDQCSPRAPWPVTSGGRRGV